MIDMRYTVKTVYDDGFVSERTFDDITSAKGYFHNVDIQDIESCVLLDTEQEGEVARKEPKKKKEAPAE